MASLLNKHFGGRVQGVALRRNRRSAKVSNLEMTTPNDDFYNLTVCNITGGY
jgi:hypothetical protein